MVMQRAVRRWIGRLRSWLGHRPPAAPFDPYAWKPAPLKPKPKGRAGSVAVAEPDE
jgi:hypothetical protein